MKAILLLILSAACALAADGVNDANTIAISKRGPTGTTYSSMFVDIPQGVDSIPVMLQSNPDAGSYHVHLFTLGSQFVRDWNSSTLSIDPSQIGITTSDVAGLDTWMADIVDALNLKQDAAGTFPWSQITGKPSTFSPSAHTHPWADITGTPTTLSGYGISDPVVLTSGSYSNPSWITALAVSKVTGLSTVATSGAYNDLSGKPTLGTAAAQNTTAFDAAGSAAAAQAAAASDATTKANAAQAAAIQRSNHTGTQAQSTVTNLVSDLAGKFANPSGTTAQYLRGDGSLATFPTNNTAFTNGAGYLTTEVDGSVTNEIELPSQTGQSGKFLSTNGTSPSWVTSSISRTFTNPSRSLNTAFQVSATQDAFVSYTVDVGATLTITGGQTGTVTLQYADNSGMSTNLVTVQSSANGNTGTLTVGLSLTQTSTAALTGRIPAGKFVRIATANTVGTPSFTFRAAQEVIE